MLEFLVAPRCHRLFANLPAHRDEQLVGLGARAVFAAVLFTYFVQAGLSKIAFSDNIFWGLDDAAFYQILPLAVENYGYDIAAIPWFPHAIIVYAGSFFEIILPVLIIIGFLTHWAALGMIGFIAVQSIVDVVGHGVGAAVIGAWFDGAPDAELMDQRLLWAFLLAYLAVYGAGALSADGWLKRRIQHQRASHSNGREHTGQQPVDQQALTYGARQVPGE